MNILWVCPYPPLPHFGGGTRVYNLIKALAPRCTIDLIANGDAQERTAPPALASLCRNIIMVAPTVNSRRQKRLRQLRALGSLRPSHYWTTYSRAMQQRIDEVVKRQSYDVVMLEHSFSGYYRFPAHMLVVLDQHNVESEVLKRSGQTGYSKVQRAYNFVDYLKFRGNEREICQAASLVLTTSERDRDALKAWGITPPCVVVPNGVDTSYFFTTAEAPQGTREMRVVFTAAMHYAPNEQAMLHFAADIWPHVLEQAPRATLHIIGGDPPPTIRALDGASNITVTGYVPDLRPYIADADVLVVPLRIGGGTRLKILEALAMRKAVVSTSLGCEGLDVIAGKHLLVADTSSDFAAKVVSLLNDPRQRDELGREGRELVVERYDWHHIGAALEGVLQILAKQATSTTANVGDFPREV